MTKIWANSGDSHVLEPEDELRRLLSKRLTADMLDRIPRTEKDGQWETVYVDGQVIRRRIPSPVREGDYKGLTLVEASSRAPGARDVGQRIADMDNEGVWAQVVFPSLGFWNNMIKDPALCRVIAEVTNEWALETLQGHSPRLVCAALIPLRSVDDAIAEANRAHSLGFKAVFIPTSPPAGEPNWNDEHWEPLWTVAEERGLVLSSHVGTGGDHEANQTFRGPGGAVLNYVETTYSAQRMATQFVCSGALDRHPELRLHVSEGGSAWVPFLGDRMNEGYRQHSMFTRPKLSRNPKEILLAQVYTSFQHDECGPLAYTSLGYRNGMWGDDYPHLEGTYGHTQEVLHALFDDVPADCRERLTIGAFMDLFPHVGYPPEAEAA
jgi:predicted TIM-barrel fold metal-dependent hydrolase